MYAPGILIISPILNNLMRFVAFSFYPFLTKVNINIYWWIKLTRVTAKELKDHVPLSLFKITRPAACL